MKTNEYNRFNRKHNMKTLAIKGNESRGKEIKEILESFGGQDFYRFTFSDKGTLYYIPANNNTITCDYISQVDADDFEIFTIDKFKEKFKFKVGDLVHLGETPDEIYTVTGIRWDYEYGEVIYEIDGVHGDWYRYCLLNPIEKKRMTHEVPKSTRLIDNLEVVEVRDNEVEIVLDSCDSVSLEGSRVRIVRTHKYPKTYKECCSVMGVHPDNYISIRSCYCDDGEEDTTNYEQDILDIFDYLWKLRICRDAYWKIAGEQMGLGKPWEPTMETVYCISRNDNIIKCSYRGGKSNILEFPTEEMRNIFYENFKDLIEECKELL